MKKGFENMTREDYNLRLKFESSWLDDNKVFSYGYSKWDGSGYKFSETQKEFYSLCDDVRGGFCGSISSLCVHFANDYKFDFKKTK